MFARWYGRQSVVVKALALVAFVVSMFGVVAVGGCSDAGDTAGSAMNYTTTVENTGACGQAGVVCNGPANTVLINAAP